MKLIRNRKMLRMKRRRYSHLMQSFRATIHEGAQEMAKQDAMIAWLAKQLDEYGECSPPDAPCHEGGPYCCSSESPISCSKCWIKAAEKAVQDANGK